VNGPTDDSTPLTPLFARSAVGGLLMGLANLVPGISGGTMLLAAGVYPRFITAIAEVTTLRFRRESIVVLAGVAGAAGVAILLLAGPVKDLVVHHRWVMYSLFIGLTMGGVPIIKRMLGPLDARAVGGAVLGFLGMALLAVLQSNGAPGGGGSEAGFLWFLVAGLAGAAAMILPGVSGGYLLLVLEMYLPILSGIDALKEGMRAADPGLIAAAVLGVVLPTGIGVVLGIVAVSNLLRWLLLRYGRATLGFLLGLLLGAVVGLWPFQAGEPPALGSTWKGQVVTPTSLSDIDAEDWPTTAFRPSGGQVGGSIALVLAGVGLTLGIARVGGRSR